MSTDAVVTFKDGEGEQMFKVYVQHSCDPETLLSHVWDAVHYIDNGAERVGRLNWGYFATKLVCSLTSYFDKVCLISADTDTHSAIYNYTIQPIRGLYENQHLHIPLCLHLRCEYNSGEVVYDDVLDSLA